VVCGVGGRESLETVEIYAYVGNKGVGRMESPLRCSLFRKEKV
jgi:hypothetical protein